jgi:hypothetical protein
MDAWSMNSMSNYLLPYAISNLVALFLLWLSWKRPRTGILIFGIIFILAGSFNFYTASTTPEVYMQYASWVLFDFYVDFILEYFRNNAGIIVKMIAMGQLLTGTLLLIKKERTQFAGVLGGIIFFIAIAPLGFGSAFPATLVMALTLFIGYKRSLRNQARKIY